jgi:hypothetical protein
VEKWKVEGAKAPVEKRGSVESLGSIEYLSIINSG